MIIRRVKKCQNMQKKGGQQFFYEEGQRKI